jgi:DNA gyrase/topoisomerase IV subunit B
MKCWFKLARLSLQTWASLSEQTLENAKRMNNKEKRARFRYLGHLKPGQLDGEQMSPEQRLEKIRQLQKENNYLKRQREILSLVLSSVDPRLC